MNGDVGSSSRVDNINEDWFTLKLNQVETSDGFRYSIFVNDKEVTSDINTTPKIFTNVQAEFGRIRDYHRYQIAVGSYRNLEVTSKLTMNFSK